VQPQAQHAGRLSVLDRVDGRIADLRTIDDGHATASLDLDGVVGPDESRRILVEPDTDRERVVSERGEQAAQPVTLAEMLVDDEAVGETQTGASRTLPAIMEEPSSPEAIMCSERMLAPALVPPTVTPARYAGG